MSLWTYIALFAGVLVLLNVLFVALLAIKTRTPHDSGGVTDR